MIRFSIGALLLASLPASAQQDTPRFAAIPHGVQSGAAQNGVQGGATQSAVEGGVWILDTQTGEVSFCFSYPADHLQGGYGARCFNP